MRLSMYLRSTLSMAVAFGMSASFFSLDADAASLFGGRKKAEQSVDDYAQHIAAGSYAEAAAVVDAAFGRRARRQAEKGEVHGRSLQLYLMKASALRWAGDRDAASAAFDLAEEAIKDYETRILGGGALESVGAAFGGARVKRYKPKAADGILVNTYKAVQFMESARLDDARVELHRADERTRRAVELFAKEIEREAAEAEEKKQADEGQVETLIGQHYPEISHWEVYDDFVNPYSVYLHALFFFAAGEGASDIEKASTSIKRVAGMYPDSPVLAADIAMIEGIASGNQSRADLPDMLWVVCEDGLAPRIDTKLVDFPLPVDNQLVPVRLALQELAPMPAAAGGCVARAEGVDHAADEIGSMDRIVQTEFSKRLPREVAQAIAGALTRGVIQNEAQKQAGVLGLMAGAVYQEQTATAETRVWEGLPKAWYAARLPRPADGVIEVLDPDGGLIARLEVPPARLALAHVRLPSRAAQPATSIAVLAAPAQRSESPVQENTP